ncbi:MAG: T9SS type A sorting domain-containing protein [Bacteroidetes bacterium]|nr:T9SS type A sorting domain-containing protein [Bacteroidota bacterium]MCY4204747.1 T9SS type A sorting domain-containing protein [Bacteroidota bacterium]
MPKSKKKSGNVIAVLKVTVTDDDVEDTASEERSELPKEVAIQGSYPNPFRGATTIAFDLPEQAEVYAEVFDVLGRLIFSSEIHKMDAGWDHSLSLEFPTTSSGLYIYRFNVKTASGILSKTGRIIQVR